MDGDNDYPKALAMFLSRRHETRKESKELSDYLFVRWSMTHFVMLLSIVLVLVPLCLGVLPLEDWFLAKDAGKPVECSKVVPFRSQSDQPCKIGAGMPARVNYCLILSGVVLCVLAGAHMCIMYRAEKELFGKISELLPKECGFHCQVYWLGGIK
jgi:hypothetical protein